MDNNVKPHIHTYIQRDTYIVRPNTIYAPTGVVGSCRSDNGKYTHTRTTNKIQRKMISILICIPIRNCVSIVFAIIITTYSCIQLLEAQRFAHIFASNKIWYFRLCRGWSMEKSNSCHGLNKYVLHVVGACLLYH